MNIGVIYDQLASETEKIQKKGSLVTKKQTKVSKLKDNLSSGSRIDKGNTDK